MLRILKYLALVALLLVVVIGGAKLYSAWRAQKPAEVSKTAEAGALPEGALDLNEKQVASIKIDKVGSASFVSEKQAVGDIDYNQSS